MVYERSGIQAVGTNSNKLCHEAHQSGRLCLVMIFLLRQSKVRRKRRYVQAITWPIRRAHRICRDRPRLSGICKPTLPLLVESNHNFLLLNYLGTLTSQLSLPLQINCGLWYWHYPSLQSLLLTIICRIICIIQCATGHSRNLAYGRRKAKRQYNTNIWRKQHHTSRAC